eukprot:jgi/Mesvir1/23598/Mv18284-RA.1
MTTSSLIRFSLVAGPSLSTSQAPNALGRRLPPVPSFDRGSLKGRLAFMRQQPVSSGNLSVSGSTRQRRTVPATVTGCLAAADAVAEGTFTSVSAGSPEPLGVSLDRNTGAINFAIYSEHATSVTLCILEDESSNVPTKTFELDATKGHRTGPAWHIAVKGLPTYCRYAYRVGGQGGWETGSRWDSKSLLIDPYAKLVDGRRVFKTGGITPFFGVYDVDPEPFDWGADYKLPNIPEKDLIIYEMSVRGFTADASSELPDGMRGSYLGVVEKVDHLKELGVNAVELLPVYEFDELEFQRRENPRKHMVNTWGYSTVNFFAPMTRYASNGGGPRAAAREFKQMVKTLHAAGIEVILDVVYNHTAENDDQHPYMLSFRGVDNLVYYMVDTNSYVQLMNFSGCGNSFNCNHPAVMRLVLDSLRHWVTEYHVDGFRFDLASSLCRDTRGQPMASPTILRAIAHDDVLKRCKIIAEPWDCGGLYQVGSFPNWDRWAEWNGKYRDCIRRFVKGTGGQKKELATRLSGSADLYNTNKRKPYHSINFVIAHDGFTLRDLVSYNYKHNEANGEGGSDGANDNESWNHGVEGGLFLPCVTPHGASSVHRGLHSVTDPDPASIDQSSVHNICGMQVPCT